MVTARASLQGPSYRLGHAVTALYRRTLTEFGRLPGIGIRLALSVSTRRVTGRFALQGIALAALGAAVGAGAAVLFIEVLRRLTPDARPLDAWTVAGVVVVLAAVSVAAAVVPARRAARVDPMLTLRAE